MSPGCQHCYAETLDKRVGGYGGQLNWGQHAPRYVTSEDNWRKPLAWDRAAAAGRRGTKTGRVRPLVFCASLADVFEARPDLVDPRARLFDLIERTPHLDWLLLTKRVENVAAFLPPSWMHYPQPGDDPVWTGPPNVWIGTTVEDQQRAQRLWWLVSIPAPVRFVSCEPLLGPVDLTRITVPGEDDWHDLEPPSLNALTGHVRGPDDVLPHHVDWVIVGGESGPGHRPLDLDHARTIRDHCSGKVVDMWGVNNRLPIPFFFKQVGGHTTHAGGDLLDGEQIRQFPGEAGRG